MGSPLDMITRLNRGGRDYLLTDPLNRRLGMRVFEKVNDDLSCLVFHLQENPFLVGASHGSEPVEHENAGRKRKRLPSTSKQDLQRDARA
jgi:hypothetical protein